MSRTKHPKQFLNLFNDYSMIQMTFNRLEPLVEPKNLLVITNRHQKKIAERHLPFIPPDNIIGEPLGKDTAPCIGLGALLTMAHDPSAVMVVLPADHLIFDVDEFRRIINLASELAAEVDCLITIGITPTRPETGYGYIQGDSRPVEKLLPEKFHNKGFVRVKAFAEKPTLGTAQRFIESGDFLWNSGIFVWKASVILREIEEHLPELYDSLMKINKHVGKKGFNRTFITAYREINSISIDYGVMEKSHNVFMIKGDFGWSDVGNWEEFYRLKCKDRDGNVIIGKGEVRNSHNNLIISDKGLIAAIGVEDIVIINFDNVVLVCPRNRSQEIKEIVDYLTRKEVTEFL